MEASGEGQKAGGEKPKPVRVDRQLIGIVQFVIDGPTGKDGIQAKASRISDLDDAIARTEKTIRDLDNEIEGMRRALPVGGLAGPLVALIEGKFTQLNRAQESLEAFQKERREKSVAVCKGIASIEEFIYDYAKEQEEYKSAGKIQKMLRNMILYSSLCGNAYASIERINEGRGGDGSDDERAAAENLLKNAENLLKKNKESLENALAEYWGEVGQYPRWTGYMPRAFEPEDKHSAVQAKSVIEANLVKLTEKMKEYILEIKSLLPGKIAPHYLSDEKKEYFQQRAKAETSGDDSPEVPEDNT